MTWSDSYIGVVSELERGRKGSGRRKVDNNTYLETRPEGTVWEYGMPIALRLHATDILTYRPDGITYRTGGWETVTTKDRMNKFGPLRISQSARRWYVKVGDDWKGTSYSDGMVVAYDGDIISGNVDPAAERERDATDKAIRRYAKLCADALPLPDPSGGDCWGCYFRSDDATSEPLGTDHYLDHMREGYVVPSLVWNATRARGYGNAAVVWRMRNDAPIHAYSRSDVARDVRRYLGNRLGTSKTAETASTGY